MAFILKSGQKVQLALELTDRDGNAVAAEGTPVWASSDASFVAVDASGVASDPEGPGVGAATITATVDADLGEGVKEVTGTIDIEVVAGDAAVVNITAGEPTDR